MARRTLSRWIQSKIALVAVLGAFQPTQTLAQPQDKCVTFAVSGSFTALLVNFQMQRSVASAYAADGAIEQAQEHCYPGRVEKVTKEECLDTVVPNSNEPAIKCVQSLICTYCGKNRADLQGL